VQNGIQELSPESRAKKMRKLAGSALWGELAQLWRAGPGPSAAEWNVLRRAVTRGLLRTPGGDEGGAAAQEARQKHGWGDFEAAAMESGAAIAEAINGAAGWWCEDVFEPQAWGLAELEAKIAGPVLPQKAIDMLASRLAQRRATDDEVEQARAWGLPEADALPWVDKWGLSMTWAEAKRAGQITDAQWLARSASSAKTFADRGLIELGEWEDALAMALKIKNGADAPDWVHRAATVRGMLAALPEASRQALCEKHGAKAWLREAQSAQFYLGGANAAVGGAIAAVEAVLIGAAAQSAPEVGAPRARGARL
jgi:hypothetical protein